MRSRATRPIPVTLLLAIWLLVGAEACSDDTSSQAVDSGTEESIALVAQCDDGPCTKYFVSPNGSMGGGLTRESPAHYLNPSFWNTTVRNTLDADPSDPADVAMPVTVYFLPGTYLPGTDPVSLQLQELGHPEPVGHELTLESEQPGAAVFMQSSAGQGWGISIEGSHDITVRGFGFTQPQPWNCSRCSQDGCATGAPLAVITFDNQDDKASSRITLDSNHFHDMPDVSRAAIMVQDGAAELTITNNIFERVGCDGHAHMVYLSHDIDGVRIAHNTFTDSSGEFVKLSDKIFRPVITDNLFVLTGGLWPVDWPAFIMLGIFTDAAVDQSPPDEAEYFISPSYPLMVQGQEVVRGAPALESGSLAKIQRNQFVFKGCNSISDHAEDVEDETNENYCDRKTPYALRFEGYNPPSDPLFPPGERYLLVAEGEGETMSSGTSSEKRELFRQTLKIIPSDFDLQNNCVSGANYNLAFESYPAFGANCYAGAGLCWLNAFGSGAWGGLSAGQCVAACVGHPYWEGRIAEVYRALASSSARDLYACPSVNQRATVWVHRSTGSSYEYRSSYRALAGFDGVQQWLVGDFNQDGEDDLAVIQTVNQNVQQGLVGDAYNMPTLAVFLHRYGNFEYQSWQQNLDLGLAGARWFVGDFDDDGHRDDLVATTISSGTVRAKTYTSDGSTLVATPGVSSLGTHRPLQHWLVGDFGGDARDDFASIHAAPNGTSTVLTHVGIAPTPGGVRFQANFGSTATDSGFAASHKWRVGKFNADSLDDLVLVYGFWTGSGHQAVASTQFSRGGGTFRLNSTLSWLTAYSETQQWVVGNSNGDGLDDLMDIQGSAGQPTVVRVHRATTTGFEQLSSSSEMGAFNIDQRWMVGRFQPGSALRDLVHVQGSPAW